MWYVDLSAESSKRLGERKADRLAGFSAPG